MDKYKETEDFFNKNANSYATSKSHANDDDLKILINSLNLKDNYTGLDIATGTGFTAIELAKHIKRVIAIDITDNMINEAKKLANQNSLDNIGFINENAEHMEFNDSYFDVITCRRAAHHFHDKNKVMKESCRVLKNNGLFGIDDMTTYNRSIDTLNDLEKIRDRSHVEMLSKSGWINIFENNNFDVVQLYSFNKVIPFSEWLRPVSVNSDTGKKCRDFILNASEDFLKDISWDSRNETFIKKWLVIIGKKIY